ncbi:MAG: RNA polymerase sigma factor [Acidobacteriota bacterium]
MEQARESELALVARLRAGEMAAFDEVYDAYRPQVYGFLVRLSRSRDVADDLLEELWLRLVRHAERLRPDTCLGPWLYTVARNLYLNYCRSRATDETVESAACGLWPQSPAQATPFEIAAASELERHIERAIARMPSRHREVLLLVAVEGFAPTEAAAICHVSPEALRQRLFRARALLARELARLDKAPSAAWREVTA